MASLLKDASLEELVKGYKETDDYYICLFCGKAFEKGEIFEENNHFYEAKKMVEIHTEKEHGSVLDCLFDLDGKDFGLTDGQLAMWKAFAYDKSDEEIYDEFQITPSTIRNYRQKLREKQQQAKLLMALSVLIDEGKQKGTLHLNRKEKQVIQNFFNVDGTLREIPSKEKKRLIVLKHIIQPLKVGKVYSESELIKFLKPLYKDSFVLKEALMETGLIEEKEGHTYIKVKSK